MAQTKSSKVRKKKWYPLLAPRIFRNVVLGETLVYDQDAIMGKTITQNLMNLTGDVKKQNISMDFVVNRIEDGKAHTEIIGYHMIPTSVKRLTRRNSEKIDLSFSCHTVDGKHIRIKPLIFAISSTKGSVGAHLRKTAQDYLIKTIKKMTYDSLVIDLINHKFQYSLKDNIKKIYPVRVSEIRDMHLETEKKQEEEKVTEKTTSKKDEEKPKELKKESKEETSKKPEKEEAKEATNKEEEKAEAEEEKENKTAEKKESMEEQKSE